MQGPRMLSHSTSHKVVLVQPNANTTEDQQHQHYLQQNALRAEHADKEEVPVDHLASTPAKERWKARFTGRSDETIDASRGMQNNAKRLRRARLQRAIEWSRRHLRFLGPGLIASAAYIDPGNYATDLSAGAGFGYKLLFIVLFSGLVGILMQVLAARLGIVTGKDVAALCREALHSSERHTMLWRWGVLYPLYFIAESGIIFTDLAELLGTAIAFKLLIPALPLWAGVLLTSLDVFIVLIAFNTYPSSKRNRSITAFEIMISILVMTVLASFIVLLVRLAPDWGDVFEGYLPSDSIVADGALYISVGIIGATVMPHALFLGSKLGTIERMDFPEIEEDVNGEEGNLKETAAVGITSDKMPTPRVRARSRSIAGMGPSLHMPHPTPMPSFPLTPRDANHPRTLRSVKIHVHHAQVDIIVSLLSFALVVNSAILIVAGAAFFYRDGPEDTSEVQDGNLFSAHALIKSRIGEAFSYLFALALMMSGQAASITATLAGQVVSEGFIEWRTKPWKRRLITRLISMVPSLIVAAAVGEAGVNTLLVASQVTLSLVLPFVMFPLLAFTSSNSRMSIKLPSEPVVEVSALLHAHEELSVRERTSHIASDAKRWWRETTAFEKLKAINPFGSRPSPRGKMSFANNYFIVTIGWAIFCLTVIADVYAMVQLGLGQA